MMSSQGIVFVPTDGLEPGMNGEIVIPWPPLLDDHQDGEAEARILSYHFHAAEPAQAEQRAESAGAA